MTKRTWMLKAQHDTFQQCVANSIVLAAPVLIAACNTKPELSLVEVAGWAIWICAWVYENTADRQKKKFVLLNARKAKELNDQIKMGKQNFSQKNLDEIKNVVLGMEPYNGPEYSLWTQCRHPNYFGEWCCWLGLSIAAIPSAIEVCQGNIWT